MNYNDDYADDASPATMTAPTQAMGDNPAYVAPAATSMHDAIMTQSGEFAPEWYSRFEDLKGYAPTLSKFRRPEALAKSYAALERMKGYPGVENAQQMESFRRVVGLPDSAEDYSLTRPENTPDELWNEDFVRTMSKMAYEYGIPAPAMDALTQKYCGECDRMMQEQQRLQQESLLQADADLQLDWGTQYDDNMAIIGSTLQHLGQRAGVDVQSLVETPALRANTDFAKLILEVSGLMQESPMRTGTPSNSKQEAYRIAHDPTHPLHEAYMRTSHPQHRYANEQYDRLAFGRRG
ncbi:MAG: hypothetical protein R3Y56_03165 [Akkermansia sp.]